MASYSAEKKSPRKLSDKEAAEIVQEVRENAELHWNHERHNIDEATMDLRFLANDQWPDAAKKERETQGRPMLTHNVLPQYVAQVVNPIRQADIAIKTSPVDGETDPELSKVYNGLLRQIQYQSSAKAVYAHALVAQASCGIGAFRIVHDYRDEKSFDQEIYLEVIRNGLCVFWDPSAREATRADAMWMGIAEAWPLQAFKRRWPDAVAEDVELLKSYGDSSFWFSTETVRVAEYFRKVPKKTTLAKTADGQVIDITDMGEAEAGKLNIQATRTVQGYKVEHYFVSGAEKLEGPTEVPGCHIPIILCLGGEVALEKGTYRYGVCRFVRDAQQGLNLTETAIAEAVGGSPKAPWLVPDKAIAKHKSEWDTHNRANRPYLRYTPVVEGGALLKPERTEPIQVQPALIQQSMGYRDAIKSGTGIFDASQGNRSNETSGVAIDARKVQGEVANYHFLDNFQASLEHAGRVIIDWIPRIYDNERVMRILGEDGQTEETVPINMVQYGQDGQAVMVNDLSAASFDIRVKIGPSFATRRQEAQAFTTELMKVLPPEMAASIADLVAHHSDAEGAEQIAKRLKAMVPPEIIQAAENMDKEGGQPMPPPQPEGPPPEALMQQFMLMLKDMAAKIEKTQAETQKAQAQTDQIRAQTEQTAAATAKTVVEIDHATQRGPHEMEHQRAQTRNLLAPEPSA